MVRFYTALFVVVGFLVLAVNSQFVRDPEQPAVQVERAELDAPAIPVERAALVRQAPSRAQRQANAALIIPVSGITRRELADTWGHARSEGRGHQGIDIMAPRNSAVIAAVDGRIVKFFESDRGGITIYQFDARGRYVYYYAHLETRRAGLAEGDLVRQGDVIGYVGSSGNATTPHLHFEIQLLEPGARWWRATSVNPYPYLIAGETPA